MLSQQEIELFGLNEPYDLLDSLEKLIEASEILLNSGYDGHGHEIIQQCVIKGKTHHEKI